MKIIKYIAPKIMSINGRPSPCECDDRITCAYCVQASLLGFEKKFADNDKTKTNIIAHIKRNGIRQTARDLGIQPSNVIYWIKTKNIPQWVLEKYRGCSNP